MLLLSKPKDNIIIPICATKMSTDSHNDTYQTKILNNTGIATINGLLNTNGGKLSLRYDVPQLYHNKGNVRKIEQKICEFTGEYTLAYGLNFDKKPGCIDIVVNKSKTGDIFTLNLHLYLPTDQQVIKISSKCRNVEEVRNILTKNVPFRKPIELGSHVREFTKGAEVNFGESPEVQFKQLAAKRTKGGTSLAKRVKSNKFTNYAGAFANLAGGHFYLGIKDDCIVEGELITPQDITELENMIRKAVGGMIWPDDCQSQVNGEENRWKIHYEPVKDSSGAIIPSTFVIVVYIAQCLGGVFTKEPECYQMEDGEAKRMDFPTWKHRIIHGLVAEKDETSKESSGSGIDASHDSIYEMLAELLIDNCEWSDLKKASENAQSMHHEDDVRLICLSKLIKFCIMRCDYENVEKMFEEYNAILPRSTNSKVFEVMEQYLRCLLQRTQGNYDESYNIANKCFEKLDEIEPGVVSSAFYVLAATVANILVMKKEDSSERRSTLVSFSAVKELYDTSIDHLKGVQGFECIKADLRQKVYTNEVMFYSGSSLAGFMLPNFDATVMNETKAQDYLDKTHHIVTHEKFPLSDLRHIQKCLAESDFFYRASKSDETKKKKAFHMKKALKFANRAERSANDARLPEMERYAQNRATFIQKEMINC